jgi:hypothetical protein
MYQNRFNPNLTGNKVDFQAIFDYEKNGAEDISMRKHDLLKVIINK